MWDLEKELKKKIALLEKENKKLKMLIAYYKDDNNRLMDQIYSLKYNSWRNQTNS